MSSSNVSVEIGSMETGLILSGKVVQAIVGPRLLDFQTKKIAEEFLECNRRLIKKALPLSI
jgi:trehalose-6-phosphate synthase